MHKQYCYLIIVHIDKGKESAMAKKDLTGERHGDLVVLGASENKYASPNTGKRISLWKVKCLKCGNIKEMQASHFYRCVTCGCVRRRKYHNCVICGKPFIWHPSDTKQCCSAKCAAQLRKKHGLCTPKGTPMPPALIEAQKKSQLVKAARERFAKEATKAAHALPEGQPGPQNRTAKKWILIDPLGNYYIAVSLKDWARRNCRRFFDEDVPENIAAGRVRGGFTAIASSLRGVSSRRSRPVYTYKGWRLEELPVEKTEEDVKMALEENRRQNGEEKEKS